MLTAAELIETLSAPFFNKISTSFTELIPPPTVKGISIASTLRTKSEIDFEKKQMNDYKGKRCGVNGDWVAQELLLIKPIQDQVLNVVQSIAKQKKFDKIFDQSADAIVLYSEKKYDISDLVLKSILRSEKLEKLNLEFSDESFNPELEEKKKELEEKKLKKAEEIKTRRELLLKQKEEKRKAYQRKRDSLLELRRK